MRFKTVVITTLGLTLAIVLSSGLAIDATKISPKAQAALAALSGLVDQIPAQVPADSGDAERATAEATHKKLQQFIKDRLLPLCVDQVFVSQTKSQNDQHVSLDEIKKIDEQWIAAEEELPIHKEKMGNGCAAEIARVAKALGIVGETFVMDNQGANVGQNALTSDYWQGDEAKWIEPFNKGQGGVHISKPKLDKSTNQVDQKVALPIIDEDGKVIGAVCYGIATSKLDSVPSAGQ